MKARKCYIKRGKIKTDAKPAILSYAETIIKEIQLIIKVGFFFFNKIDDFIYPFIRKVQKKKCKQPQQEKKQTDKD